MTASAVIPANIVIARNPSMSSDEAATSDASAPRFSRLTVYAPPPFG
jgi:hypothetical protein